MKISKTQILVECAVMMALATVLSLFKVVQLPYGGSVTAASMLPLVVLSYRHGTKWGLGAGICYGIRQQLIDLGTLSYVTTWQSVVAVIL
ncbi:MAG: energy-coupled thiamine transporter ThiT, partial [Clostridia bacterium]|nr:energy-coupled thiamine transporter ThiT [Clostridia bacterium]